MYNNYTPTRMGGDEPYNPNGGTPIVELIARAVQAIQDWYNAPPSDEYLNWKEQSHSGAPQEGAPDTAGGFLDKRVVDSIGDAGRAIGQGLGNTGRAIGNAVSNIDPAEIDAFLSRPIVDTIGDAGRAVMDNLGGAYPPQSTPPTYDMEKMAALNAILSAKQQWEEGADEYGAGFQNTHKAKELHALAESLRQAFGITDAQYGAGTDYENARNYVAQDTMPQGISPDILSGLFKQNINNKNQRMRI